MMPTPTSWSFSEKSYPFFRNRLLRENLLLNTNWIARSVKKIQFVNDVFCLLYIRNFIQNDDYSIQSIWKLCFVLTSSRIHFLLWNEFFTDVLFKICYLLFQKPFVSWIKILWSDPKKGDPGIVHSARDLFSQICTAEVSSNSDWIRMLVKLFLFEPSIMWILVSLLRIAGMFVLFPIQTKLFFSLTFMSSCLWIEVTMILWLIQNVLKIESHIRLQLEDLWKQYHLCSTRFRDFQLCYGNYHVSTVEPHDVVSQVRLNQTRAFLLYFVSSECVDQMILPYFLDSDKVLFDNWIEIPNPENDYSHVRAFLYANNQIFTTVVQSNDPLRTELRWFPNGGISLLPQGK